MKIRFLFFSVLILLGLVLHAQDFDQNCYYTIAEMPDASVYLPAPPTIESQLFGDDFQQWIWGKSVRGSERGVMASKDSKMDFAKMAEIYGEVMGFTISKKKTPAIWRFLVRAGDTGHSAVKKAKDFYMRTRPFALMNEHTAGEFDNEEDLRNNGSYPSGHTATGWSTALALAEMAPEMQDAILQRGYQYGESRVIVGAHWQSDVDAARLASAAAIARMHCHQDYMLDLKAARLEFLKKSKLVAKSIPYPDGQFFLDPQVDTSNARFYGDMVQYWQAKKERGTLRGQQAVADADYSVETLLECFSPTVGLTLSMDETPHIVLLLEKAREIFIRECACMKTTGFRKRPYVQLNDSSMVFREQDTGNQSSYPSTNAAVGWGLALVLVEIAPENQNDILKRGYEYGRSSIITGCHYASDVHAGRILASCVFVRMQIEPEFKALLEKARREYENIQTR